MAENKKRKSHPGFLNGKSQRLEQVTT